MLHRLDRLLQRARWTAMAAFLAVMPVNHEFGAPAPVDTARVPPYRRTLELGGAAGQGRVFAVIRDCNGDKVSETGADFRDWSAHAALSLPFEEHAEVVLGARVDGMNLDATGGDDGLAWPERSYTWVTPSIAAEGLHAGVGAGVVLGDRPDEFGRGGGTSLAPLSMHLRVGRRDRMFLKVSYLEAHPAMSGGGPLMAQFGYPLWAGAGGSTGVAGSWYDTVGLVQTLDLRLGPRWALNLSVRFPLEDVGERAAAAGLRYRLPLDGER